MNIKNIFRKVLDRGPVSVTLAVVLSVLFVTGLVNAATTISTNISTAGTLTVDTTSTLTGAVAMGSTLSVTGNTTLASTTATAFKVGQVGTQSTLMLSGTCSLVSNVEIAATSTGTGTCAATGAVAGDRVFVSLATTTTKVAAQWVIVGTVAAADSVTVRLLNQTGTAAVPSATNGLGSSTQYWIVR